MFADLSATLPTEEEQEEFAARVTENARGRLGEIGEAFPREPNLRLLGRRLFLAIHLYHQEVAANGPTSAARDTLKAVGTKAMALKKVLNSRDAKGMLETGMRRRAEQEPSRATASHDEAKAIWAALDDLPQLVDFMLSLPDWGDRLPNPVQTLLGRSLPTVARQHFRIPDTFDRAKGSESAVTLFVQAVIEEAELSVTSELDTIGTYISKERAFARARVKNRG